MFRLYNMSEMNFVYSCIGSNTTSPTELLKMPMINARVILFFGFVSSFFCEHGVAERPCPWYNKFVYANNRSLIELFGANDYGDREYSFL